MPKVQELSEDDNLDQLLESAGSVLVLVDFFAQWCGPCRQISPKIEELAAKHVDKLIVLKVDVDALPEVASTCGVECMPTFHFYKSKELVGNISGANASKLCAMVEQLM